MRCPRRSDSDRGAVTVEAAIAVGALVLVAAALIAAVAAVLASVRCVDAARELARAASRDDTDRGRVTAARIAPSGAGMDVSIDGDVVTVVVTAAPIGLLPLEVSGSATGLLEPGVVRDSAVPIPISDPAEDGAGTGDTAGTEDDGGTGSPGGAGADGGFSRPGGAP